MTNGNPNLDEYFPSGSRANVIKNEIANEIERGTLNFDGRVATLVQIQEMKNEQRKNFWIGQGITIFIVIILWGISKYFGL